MESPFDAPPIMMKKVTLDELHNLLRQRTNKSYMPSDYEGDAGKPSYGWNARPHFNSKPEYLDAERYSWPEFLQAVAYWGCSGYFCRDGGHHVKTLWACLRIGFHSILVNLVSLQTYLVDSAGVTHQWHSTQELAVDRFALYEQIDLL